MERLWRLLQEEELPLDAVTRLPKAVNGNNSSNVAIKIERGNFSWDPTARPHTLTGVELEVKIGVRVAVCGVVGCGKTSLLSCILGEIPVVSGNVRFLHEHESSS